MITKGKIIEVVDNYSYRVRIPIFDSIENALDFTADSDLAIAVSCSSPASKNFYSVGDIVFVSFEDNDYGRPIILGHLNYEGNITKQDIDLQAVTINSLSVLDSVILPDTTVIGDIPYSKLFYIINVKKDIQEQFDDINIKIIDLYSKISQQGSSTVVRFEEVQW